MLANFLEPWPPSKFEIAPKYHKSSRNKSCRPYFLWWKNTTTVFLHELINVKVCKLVTSLQSFVSLFSYSLFIYLRRSEECYLFYLTKLNLFLFWKSKSTKRSNTFAVLNTTFLQSGRILTDQAGRSYCLLRKVTTLSLAESIFARNATHPPDWSL